MEWSRIIGNKDNPVANVFFSNENKSRLHRLIIRGVYDRTDGQVSLSQQSDTELHMIMVKTIQSEYNVYLDIKELNVGFCVNNIIQNIGFYMQYLRDVNEGPNKTNYDKLRNNDEGVIDAVIGRPVNTRVEAICIQKYACINIICSSAIALSYDESCPTAPCNTSPHPPHIC